MKVSAQGNLFAQSHSNGLWYVWLNFTWQPAGATVPVGPIPMETNLAQTLRTDITTSTPRGTLVSTISVKMSDGSLFAGTMAVNNQGGPVFVGISGSAPNLNLVTIGTPVIQANSFTVTASQNGVSASTGACNIDIVVSS
jgi:hypothetical protein